jgi:hypothetical protein|tara:strand:+ start:377 stop:628 length:252 start_codon:yes stop_codon:yes gene_type:complete
MSWKNVWVKNGKQDVSAFMRGDELELPNILGEPTTVIVDGKSRSVESWRIDERDDIIKILLKPPVGEQKKKGEPDGESTKSTS